MFIQFVVCMFLNETVDNQSLILLCLGKNSKYLLLFKLKQQLKRILPCRNTGKTRYPKPSVVYLVLPSEAPKAFSLTNPVEDPPRGCSSSGGSQRMDQKV